MSASRQALGRAGEDLALGYLLSQGWKLEARNWRVARGEIDLIMRDGEALVLVEVRYRSTPLRGQAAESLSSRKRNRLSNLALHYLAQTQWQGPIRVDLVAIQARTESFVDGSVRGQSKLEGDMGGMVLRRMPRRLGGFPVTIEHFQNIIGN